MTPPGSSTSTSGGQNKQDQSPVPSPGSSIAAGFDHQRSGPGGDITSRAHIEPRAHSVLWFPSAAAMVVQPPLRGALGWGVGNVA